MSACGSAFVVVMVRTKRGARRRWRWLRRITWLRSSGNGGRIILVNIVDQYMVWVVSDHVHTLKYMHLLRWFVGFWSCDGMVRCQHVFSSVMFFWFALSCWRSRVHFHIYTWKVRFERFDRFLFRVVSLAVRMLLRYRTSRRFNESVKANRTHLG